MKTASLHAPTARCTALAALAVLLCLLVFTGAQAKDDRDYVVRVGYYNCDHMTAAPVAYDSGIFEKQGLKVEITGTGKVPEAMAAGKMDVGYIGFVGMLQAIKKGSPMVTVAYNHMGGSKFIIVSPDIKKPADLIGKRLGIGPSPEKLSADWVRFTKAAGIPVGEKNYEVFAMADRDKYLALKTGKIDGFFACDPWGSMAEYEKTGRIMHTFVTLPSGKWGICCTLVMNKDFVKEHPELAKKVIQGHVQALQMIYTQPAKAAQIFAKNYHVPEEVAMMTIYRKTVGENRTLRWKISREAYQDETKNLGEIGIVTNPPKFENVVNTGLIAESGVPDFDTFMKERVDPVFPVHMVYQDWKKKAGEIDMKSR
jgi:NitT/TauT family transport system substrate-binding protein